MSKAKKLIFLLLTLICTIAFSSTAYAGQWKQDSTGWWYENDDNSYPAGSWQQVNGIWYYFHNNGYMATGWQQIGGSWYYLHTSGAMTTGWQNVNGTWYYMENSGRMLTSTITPDGYSVGADGAWIVNSNSNNTYSSYILNSDTDTNSQLNSIGVNDMKVVCALLKKNSVTYTDLNEREQAVYTYAKNYIVKNPRSSDYDTVYDLAIHLYPSVQYEIDGYDCYSPYGVTRGYSVCEGFARMFKIIMNAYGFDCYYAHSSAHAWNKIKVDDTWFNVDVLRGTNDSYLLFSDSEYGISYTYQKGTYPACEVSGVSYGTRETFKSHLSSNPTNILSDAYNPSGWPGVLRANKQFEYTGNNIDSLIESASNFAKNKIKTGDKKTFVYLFIYGEDQSDTLKQATTIGHAVLKELRKESKVRDAQGQGVTSVTVNGTRYHVYKLIIYYSN